MSAHLSRRRLLQAATAVTAAGVVGVEHAYAGTVAWSLPTLAERFAAPAADLYPGAHWLLPLAATSSAAGITREIEAMADAGIRSAELFPWVVPGGDLSTHGWGTPAWNARVHAALAAAQRRGVTIDLLIAPETPAGVPSITADSPGASKELVYGHTSLPGGSTFDGAVPPPGEFDLSDPYGQPERVPGTPELVAVTAARLVGSPPGSSVAKPVLLDPASLVDLTSSVDRGRITWTAPAGGRWLLFGFWQRGTGQRGDGAAAPVFVIDYYSDAGVDAITRFWDQHLLPSPVRRLLRHSGGSIHEDAIETQFVLPWTHGLLRRFAELRGYSLAPYLPVLFIERLHVGGGVDDIRTPQDPPDFELADGNGPRVRNDYYEILTRLYQERHLAGVTRWAGRHGLRHSAKLGPGPVLDTQSAASRVDVPEREQVFFLDGELDGYRVLAGAAHLGHRPVCASIVAPVTGEPFEDAYGVTWQRMLEIIHQNYAGGVTQTTLHYLPYPDAAGAGWPGWAPFAPLELGPGQAVPGLAEAWGPRQPTWRHLPDITGYLARQQLVLRAGRPRVDVAIYRHSYWDDGGITPIWRDPGLRRAGHSYDFVGPALLDLPTAVVEDGRLDPDGPGYRALVLHRQDTVPLPTARQILGHARAGLPTVIVGDPPSRTPFFAQSTRQDAAVRRTVAQLLAEPAVRRVAAESDVPAALTALGVMPASAYAEPVELLTVHRAADTADCYWCFNSGTEPAEVDVSFEGRGRPHALDAWTGVVTPVTEYVSADGRITTRIRLKPKQTTILAITADELPEARPRPKGRAAAPLRLTSWRLSVEDWRPGPSATETVKLRHRLDLPELQAWRQVPGLENASGIGVYTTTVRLPAVAGAELDLGAVGGTCRIIVNGRMLPPVDQTHPVADLGGHVAPGTNTIQVEVATTLRNRLRVLDESQAGTAPQDYGLLGPVILTPYV